MFSSKSKSGLSPSRVSIEEANSHIQLVHQRVTHLETIVSLKDEELIQREDKHREEVNKLNQHCFELNKHISSLTHRVKELESKLLEKNEIISENSEKFSQIRAFAPNLEKLLKLLNSLSLNKEMNGFLSEDLTNSTSTTSSSQRKLRIGQSFNIRENFSDPEEDVSHENRRKKVTQI